MCTIGKGRTMRIVDCFLMRSRTSFNFGFGMINTISWCWIRWCWFNRLLDNNDQKSNAVRNNQFDYFEISPVPMVLVVHRILFVNSSLFLSIVENVESNHQMIRKQIIYGYWDYYYYLLHYVDHCPYWQDFVMVAVGLEHSLLSVNFFLV